MATMDGILIGVCLSAGDGEHGDSATTHFGTTLGIRGACMTPSGSTMADTGAVAVGDGTIIPTIGTPLIGIITPAQAAQIKALPIV